MSNDKWMDCKEITLFPDAVCREVSDFPLVGVTVGCKWQGHFVLANAHRERWILSNTRSAEIDLVFFGPEWSGCSAMLCRL